MDKVSLLRGGWIGVYDHNDAVQKCLLEVGHALWGCLRKVSTS